MQGHAYLELLQREDPTWSIEELRQIVGLAPPPGPSAYSMKVAARTLPHDTYRDFRFPTRQDATAAEKELGDEFDTCRQPPDFRTLRVWGHDRGIDR
jgi:hypothetical protein